jgi:hypothetical protein
MRLSGGGVALVTRLAWCGLAAIFLSGFPSPASGHDVEGEDSESQATAVSSDWRPPEPGVGKWDWIQLTSGEWLKGKLNRLHDDTLEFDSTKLDDQSFDFVDVKQFVTAREHTYRFVGQRIVRGTARMKGNVVKVGSEEGVKEYPRDELVSVVVGGSRERSYWSSKWSLGVSGQQGNTEQLTLNVGISIVRETALTRAGIDYNGNLATQDNETSANNHRVVLAFDYYMNRRLYLVIPGIEVFQDEFQNIDRRLTPGAGIGYEIIDTKIFVWRVVGGLAYQGTKYISVEDGDDQESDFAIPIQTSLNLDLPNRFEWDNSYQIQIIPTDIGKTNHHVISTLSVDIWGPLDLNTTFQWDRVEQPRTGADGTTPDQNDYRITVGFELDL